MVALALSAVPLMGLLAYHTEDCVRHLSHTHGSLPILLPYASKEARMLSHPGSTNQPSAQHQSRYKIFMVRTWLQPARH